MMLFVHNIAKPSHQWLNFNQSGHHKNINSMSSTFESTKITRRIRKGWRMKRKSRKDGKGAGGGGGREEERRGGGENKEGQWLSGQNDDADNVYNYMRCGTRMYSATSFV